jgi:hypothetical protein
MAGDEWANHRDAVAEFEIEVDQRPPALPGKLGTQRRFSDPAWPEQKNVLVSGTRPFCFDTWRGTHDGEASSTSDPNNLWRMAFAYIKRHPFRRSPLNLHGAVSVDCGNFAACKAFMTQLTIYYRMLRAGHTAKGPE